MLLLKENSVKRPMIVAKYRYRYHFAAWNTACRYTDSGLHYCSVIFKQPRIHANINYKIMYQVPHTWEKKRYMRLFIYISFCAYNDPNDTLWNVFHEKHEIHSIIIRPMLFQPQSFIFSSIHGHWNIVHKEIWRKRWAIHRFSQLDEILGKWTQLWYPQRSGDEVCDFFRVELYA